MNYYFEFDDNIVGERYHAMGWRTIPHKYCVKYGVQGLTPLMPSRLSYMAQRIWAEDDHGIISYVKNRTEPYPQVDLKEFMFIKLSAVKV